MTKSFLHHLVPSKNWYIKENGIDKSAQGVRESQFTLGNGLICSRGVLEELPFDSHPGTFISGVFDRVGSKVSDIANLPNPFNLKILIGGEKLDPTVMPTTRHERWLNMKDGLLVRNNVFHTVTKNQINYESVRFISMAEKNVCLMQVKITPRTKSSKINITSFIDTSVTNVSGASEGRKVHFEIRDVFYHAKERIRYLGIQTLTHKINIGYAQATHVSVGKRSFFSNTENLALMVQKNQTLTITKYFAIYPDLDKTLKSPRMHTVKILKHAAKKGYKKILESHKAEWKKIWSFCDIKMNADADLQTHLRFNLYHMIIAGINDNGRSSIGARTLSGEGYRGHVFWDSEIFILPFFIFTMPDIAKSMLMYRINRLEQAKKIAKQRGYEGAMFPWESAYTGLEETPPWARDLDGSIIKIFTHEMEFHISADIAYALYKYYVCTNDTEFMSKYGYELLTETARFWSSKTKFNKKKKKYDIKKVIGPDEFHLSVNNNAFTNAMAKWNLFISYNMIMRLKKKDSEGFARLSKKVNLKHDEPEKWRSILSKLRLNIRPDRVIEQFDGFFKKKDVRITQYDENFMPLIPPEIKLAEIDKYKIVKQADVLMLLYLLNDTFDKKTKDANYRYYAPITVHKSSLSPAVHSLMASEIGQTQKAFRFFLLALNADVADLHRNTNEGIHAANLGGAWQCMINGFAGVQVTKETLTFNPRLPKQIRSVKFTVIWRKSILKVSISQSKIEILKKNGTAAKSQTKIRILGKIYDLSCKKIKVNLKK